MKFLKVAAAIVTLLPFLTHACLTDSSLPYCNRTDDHVTTTDEVCLAVFDALDKIDDLCNKDEIVSLYKTWCMYVWQK